MLKHFGESRNWHKVMLGNYVFQILKGTYFFKTKIYMQQYIYI